MNNFLIFTLMFVFIGLMFLPIFIFLIYTKYKTLHCDEQRLSSYEFDYKFANRKFTLTQEEKDILKQQCEHDIKIINKRNDETKIYIMIGYGFLTLILSLLIFGINKFYFKYSTNIYNKFLDTISSNKKNFKKK